MNKFILNTPYGYYRYKLLGWAWTYKQYLPLLLQGLKENGMHVNDAVETLLMSMTDESKYKRCDFPGHYGPIELEELIGENTNVEEFPKEELEQLKEIVKISKRELDGCEAKDPERICEQAFIKSVLYEMVKEKDRLKKGKNSNVPSTRPSWDEGR